HRRHRVAPPTGGRYRTGMAKASYETWTVLPHGPIEPLEDNLWRVEGSLPNMPLKRVMTVARLGSGDLVVHNPVALDAVEPSVVDLTALPDDPNVSLSVVDGTKGLEAVMTVKAQDGVSAVFADAVFNMPHLQGVQGFVLRHVTGSSGGPRVSRVARLLLIKDKAAFAAHLERLATPDLRRMILAHHETITDDPAG